jgi:iron complex transport system permease protein
MSILAFLGAVLAIFIVYGITNLRRGFSTATLLLAGVAISFFFSSLILFMQYWSNPHDAARILRYVMGSLSVVGYGEVLNVVPFVAVGCVLVLMLTHELNLMTTGEDIATSRGVNVLLTKRLAFFATSLMVGGIVAMCGPIGFVGMMAPHICRLLVGWNHRALAPATVLFGGTFLVLCQTLAQSLPTQVPVGIVTALLGGPFFLWLLLSGSSEKSLLG